MMGMMLRIYMPFVACAFVGGLVALVGQYLGGDVGGLLGAFLGAALVPFVTRLCGLQVHVVRKGDEPFGDQQFDGMSVKAGKYTPEQEARLAELKALSDKCDADMVRITDTTDFEDSVSIVKGARASIKVIKQDIEYLREAFEIHRAAGVPVSELADIEMSIKRGGEAIEQLHRIVNRHE